jgi:hypothetical protein
MNRSMGQEIDEVVIIIPNPKAMIRLNSKISKIHLSFIEHSCVGSEHTSGNDDVVL